MNEVARPGPGALGLRDISKAFGATRALSGVSFDVLPGTIHALVGENGSGKSTLIKILAGVVCADAGTIELRGDRRVARSHTPGEARAGGLRFVHQQSSTFPDLTVAENLAIGRGFERGWGGRIRWAAVRRRTADVLERFGIDARPDTVVRDLGPATRVMLAIARALQDQADATEGILVLDEPTASLPKGEVDFLLASLRRCASLGQTVVYVTHRLEEVVEVADRATVLRDGVVVETLPRERIDHGELVALMVGREVTAAKSRRAASAPRPEEAPRVVLAADRLGRGGASLALRAGEVVGLAGLLGSGRSGLLRALFGAAPGETRVAIDGRPVLLRNPDDAKRAGLGYLPENRADSLFADLTIGENLSIASLKGLTRWGRISRPAERAGTAAAMRKFLVRGATSDAPASSLSGGNQQKVMLARWLHREPRALLLDEPTQGVDVGARAEIHQLIRRAVDAGAAALLVSSDVEELAALSDRALVVRDGAIVAELRQPGLDEAALDAAIHSTREAA